MMGEAEVMLTCRNPVEVRARLQLMRRIGYWQHKYDWGATRNVYAAILRGIETGKETWHTLEIREYEDMLVTKCKDRDREDGRGGTGKGKRSHDTFFCAAYQKGECSLDAPHMARVGNEGPEKNGPSCVFLVLT